MIEPAPESALLLIDFQRDFLRPDGRMPVCQAQVAPVLVAAARAMMRFRAAGRPVIACGCRPNNPHLCRLKIPQVC